MTAGIIDHFSILKDPRIGVRLKVMQVKKRIASLGTEMPLITYFYNHEDNEGRAVDD